MKNKRITYLYSIIKRMVGDTVNEINNILNEDNNCVEFIHKIKTNELIIHTKLKYLANKCSKLMEKYISDNLNHNPINFSISDYNIIENKQIRDSINDIFKEHKFDNIIISNDNFKNSIGNYEGVYLIYNSKYKNLEAKCEIIGDAEYFIAYHRNGSLWFKINSRNGVRFGDMIVRSPYNKMLHAKYSENGILETKKYYYDNGNLEKIISYNVDGNPNIGELIEYFNEKNPSEENNNIRKITGFTHTCNTEIFRSFTSLSSDIIYSKCYHNGKIYEYNNIDNKKSGIHIEVHENGNIQEMKKYENEYMLWTIYYENGNKCSEGLIKDDKKNGNWTRWYENGVMRCQGEYKDDIENGMWIFYHENKNVSIIGTYSNGYKSNIWVRMSDSGKIDKVVSYNDNNITEYCPEQVDNIRKIYDINKSYSNINKFDCSDFSSMLSEVVII